jgi:hypothetical protein
MQICAILQLVGIGGLSAPDVYNEPCIRDQNMPGRTFAVAAAQDASAENLFVEASRSVDVGDGEEVRNGEPFPGGI